MLMAILLPALSGAREQAYRVHCLSNLRQLTVAWNSYAADNEGRLCSPRTKWQLLGEFNWAADGPQSNNNGTGNTEQAIKDGALWKYTQNVKLYNCKSDRTNVLRNYSISATMGGLSPTQSITPFTSGSVNPEYHSFRALGEIENPYQKMVFMGAEIYGEGKWLDGGIRGGAMNVQKSEGMIQGKWNNRTVRHSNGCNLSFADGHCEYWKWKDRNDEGSGHPHGFFDPEDFLRMWEALKGRAIYIW